MDPKHGLTKTDTHCLPKTTARLWNADFCVEALKDVMRRHGKPEIVNTDYHTIDASF